MTEKGDALLAELAEGLWKGLPAETGGRMVGADFNGDGPRRGLGVPGGGQEGAPAGPGVFANGSII